MEYAKDEIFKVSYNTKLNRLETVSDHWTSRCYKKIKKHKLFTTIMIAFFVFATANLAMIYSFMKILQNV